MHRRQPEDPQDWTKVHTCVRLEAAEARSARPWKALSGRPLFEPSTSLLREFRKLLPRLPIIGVGGIDTVERAVAKFQAGADAIQLYTGLVTQGSKLPRRLRHGLHCHLETEGQAHLKELIDSQHDRKIIIP